MNDLLEEVKQSFSNLEAAASKPETTKIGPIATFSVTDDELAPGINALREWAGSKVKAAVRRGYRHFAGAPLPKSGEETFDLVAAKMGGAMSALVIEVFCHGIQIGQKESHTVRLAFFNNRIEEVFGNETFQSDSMIQALQITRDPEVMDFFLQYTLASASTLGYVTGFQRSTGLPEKVWDLWVLAGTSMVTSAYIAGHQLGNVWSEREVLTRLENQIEEESDDNSE